jgi:YidC/Oxa1 family membrane protein insertase
MALKCVCGAGWFSLNVPSGLCVYWLTNNVLTTAQQVYLKRTTKVTVPQSASGTIINAEAKVVEDDGLTSSAGNGARRSRQGETFRARAAAVSGANQETLAKNPRGKKKGAKFAERKKKAAAQSAAQPSNGATPSQDTGKDMQTTAASGDQEQDQA